MSRVATPSSRREVTRSSSRPTSGRKLVDNMETMIQAAHQHFEDASRPGTRSPRWRRCDNQEDETQSARVLPSSGGIASELEATSKLADYMDSFPLIPLPIIPQLCLSDLEQVERGLMGLVGSMMSHESDQQLGRYAGRQLALVQQHLTQQRAQERVFQMLRGDLPVVLAPFATMTLRKCSSASAAVPIGLTPRSTALRSISLSSSPADRPKSGRRLRALVGSLSRSAQTHPSGSTGLRWKSKNAVEMARVMVQANASKSVLSTSSTGFVVAAGGNRKRRRPRAPTKRSPEEEVEYQAKQLERERENRRQAAYQRLLARQLLQAKRKQEQKRQKKGDCKSVHADDAGKENGQNDGSSDSESESSDVSNCSESDEANEKAILALEVQVQRSVDDVEGDTRSEHSEMGEDGDETNLISTDNKWGGGSTTAGAGELEIIECNSSRSIQPEITQQDFFAPEKLPLAAATPPLLSTHIDILTSDENNAYSSRENTTIQMNGTRAGRGEHEKQEVQKEAQTTGFDLQLFIAARAASKLEQLKAEKEARIANEPSNLAMPSDVTESRAARPITSLTSASIELSFPLHGSAEDDADAREYEEETISSQRHDSADNAVADSSDARDTAQHQMESNRPMEQHQQTWVDEIRQSSTEFTAKSPQSTHFDVETRRLPRPPLVECKDYRFYFNNFHCILTSVFEQYQGHSSAHTSSSSSLYHRPVGATGEHTMCLQQKLYESWQSIMHDYATVFGPKIAAPEGMVPMAAAAPWTPHYRINSTARKEVSEIVTQALQRLGGDWEEHPPGLGLKTTWNLLWTWSKPRVERQTLLVWQKVNHFQHAKALTRKDCLKKHIGKYLAAGGKLRQAFDIIPPTFLLPKEYVAFVQAFHERGERLRKEGFAESKNIWIMKPVALSRGRGISLVNDLSQVIYGEQVVIQEYIAAPRLLDGYKFDLRLYVLVTSFNPLEAFLYDEGFVRLCTRPYEDGDLSNIFVHLTNSSIQKANEDAIAGSAISIASVMKEAKPLSARAAETKLGPENKGETTQADAGGTKTTLAYLWRRLAAEGVDVEQVKRSIEEVVLKALLCGEDHIPFQVNSFDLLGYDILLDTDLRPWLIEINSSPSMARDYDLDYQVKDAMMLDTLRVVDPLHFDRSKLAEVIARRQRDLEDEKRRPHAHTRHPREAEELATRQLNEDLTAILRGRVPRAYGEMPENVGNYRRLCPHTSMYNQLVKLKRSCLRIPDRK